MPPLPLPVSSSLFVVNETVIFQQDLQLCSLIDCLGRLISIVIFLPFQWLRGVREFYHAFHAPSEEETTTVWDARLKNKENIHTMKQLHV